MDTRCWYTHRQVRRTKAVIKGVHREVVYWSIFFVFFFCVVFCFVFRVLFFLAHLSQRLIGELIEYSRSGVRPSSVRRSQCSRSSSPKPPIKTKFHVELPWVVGTIFCSRHLGHMTKMAATPIYGQNPSKIFSRTGEPIFTKLGM